MFIRNFTNLNGLFSGASVSPTSSVETQGQAPGKISDSFEPFYDYLEGLLVNQRDVYEDNRLYNSAEAALNREFQSKEAQIQRDWYENMSNTAYQRAVADMKKAGINPILAYQQGGASSAGTGVPTGSAASYNATGGDRLSDVLPAVVDLVSSFSGSANSLMRLFSILAMI